MHTEYFTFRCSLKKKDRIIYYHITDIELNRRYLIDITLYLYKLIENTNRIFKTKYMEEKYFHKKKSSILGFIL